MTIKLKKQQFRSNLRYNVWVQEIWNKFWRDRGGRGQVVLWQTPNIWLVGWIVLTLISLFVFSRGRTADILALAGTVSLIIWALLEIFRGANYFRRVLGLLVLIFSLMVLLKNI